MVSNVINFSEAKKSFIVGSNKRSMAVRGAILKALDCDIMNYEVTKKQLENIKRLDLSWKSINSLKSWDFEGLSGLKELRLGWNNFTELPEGIFKDLESLEILFLRESMLRVLDKDVFSGLKNLKSLWLDGNRLSQLPDGVFDGLWNLKHLDLSFNGLCLFSKDLFKQLRKLYALELQNNKLINIPDSIFDGLINLRHLNLQDNNLVEFPEGGCDVVFGGLDCLNLKGNQLSELPINLLLSINNRANIWLDRDFLLRKPKPKPGNIKRVDFEAQS